MEVIGVFELPVTAKLLKQQIDILYGSNLSKADRKEAEKQCNEQLSSTALIELLVRNRDDRFNLSDICQPLPGVPKESWQAPWAEAFLSVAGDSLISERWASEPTDRDFRVAFFMHYWKADQPLRTSYGDIQCPPVQPMPKRLQKLVPYEPLD